MGVKAVQSENPGFRAYGAFIPFVLGIPPAEAGGWKTTAATRLTRGVETNR